ncbi:MAG TPA: hypothetical protein VJH03_21580 [Blastocatellia bacterium]|nr:hypothetical protein [Blastocatellia bacterium]
MDALKTTCPECAAPLELLRDFDNVICGACGAAFRVREHKGAIYLSLIKSGGDVGERLSPDGPDLRLAALDEEIARVSAEIDEAKSKEQSGPLHVGCGVFGIFWLVIVVIAVFMTLARSYFGGKLFYLSLAAVIVVGALRLRRRLTTRSQFDLLRTQRLRLQEQLDTLEAEREELTCSGQPQAPGQEVP